MFAIVFLFQHAVKPLAFTEGGGPDVPPDGFSQKIEKERDGTAVSVSCANQCAVETGLGWDMNKPAWLCWLHMAPRSGEG